MVRNFIFFVMALLSSSYLQAQSVVGGVSKSTTDKVVKIDNFTNFDYSHLWIEEQNFPGRPNKESYIGQKFTYYNVFTYDENNAPYPWQDGRVRNGKYKASKAAFNNYVQELRSRSGEQFTLVKFVPGKSLYQPLFVNENNDTIIFTEMSLGSIVNAEMLRAEYIEQAKKMIGKTVFYTPKSLTFETGFINTNTRESVNPMPYYSQWTIKDICVDTTFFGEKTGSNDLNNRFPRLAFILENQRYGVYEFFVSGLYGNFSGWSRESKEINYISDLELKSQSIYSSFLKNNDAIIKDGCNKGYEDALFTDLYYGEYARSEYYHDHPSGDIKLYNIYYRTDSNVRNILNLVKKGFLPAIYVVSRPLFLPNYKMGSDGKRNKNDKIKDRYDEYDVVDAVIGAYENGIRDPKLGDLVYSCFMGSSRLQSVAIVDIEHDKETIQKVLKLETIAHDCGKDISVWKRIIDCAKKLSSTSEP